MGGYKHIEKSIGAYIAAQYHDVVEVGIGQNTDAARVLFEAGAKIRATDVKNFPQPDWLSFFVDDIFDPEFFRYSGADAIYAIRPAEEMIPPLIALAQRLDCDLVVYHLGFELFGNGGERIDCGVILHRYYRCQNPSKSVD
ncbi:MAG: UPF0146 family protein [Methanoregula sp.]|jgi:hypothetical protein